MREDGWKLCGHRLGWSRAELHQKMRVVGGGSTGGIIVREGKSLQSPMLPERLEIGAVVRQEQLIEGRLRYTLLYGEGPEKGWVSMWANGKELVRPFMQGNVHSPTGASSSSSAPVGGGRSSTQRSRKPEEIEFPSQRVRDGAGSKMKEEDSSGRPLEGNVVLKIRRAGTCQCPTCEDNVDAGGLCQVSYKVIVEYDEQMQGINRKTLPVPLWPPGHSQADAERTAEAAVKVPNTIQQLHPRLKPDEYSRYRHDVAFLYKVATVCEDCYLRFSAPQLGTQWFATVPASGNSAVGESDEAGATYMDDPIQLMGTKALDPERLRKRQRATQRRVLENKAAEAFETGQLDQIEEELRQRADNPQPRAQSCPKLPSWGRGHMGSVVRPPAPVLECRPRAPRDAAPLWSDMRPSRSQPAPLEMSPQRRRKLPALLGEPYLRDLQAFAFNCPGRAEFVIPSIPPPCGPRRGTRRSASVAAAPCPVPATTATASSAEVNTDGQRVSSESDDRKSTPGSVSNSVRRGVPAHLDDSDEEVFEASEGDVVVGKFWDKWPLSCGTAGAASRTPTTRPPSQGDTISRPSSFPNSRTSSRPLSRSSSQPRHWSAHSGSRAPQRELVGSERPWSSPQVVARHRSTDPGADEHVGPFGTPQRKGVPRPHEQIGRYRPASSPPIGVGRSPTS